MDKQTIKDLMESRGFTLNMTSQNKGIESYHFFSKPVYKDHNQLIIPGYCCKVNTETEEFELTYIVPKSINKLETGKCSPITSDLQFKRINDKFVEAITVLHEKFGDE